MKRVFILYIVLILLTGCGNCKKNIYKDDIIQKFQEEN